MVYVPLARYCCPAGLRMAGRALRLQRQRVDRPADLIAEHAVDELVLLDAAASRKSWGDDGRAEVVAAAGVVLDLGPGSRNRGLDALLDLLGGGHRHPD